MPFDWIEAFMEATEGVRSPVSFRLWTAIATIAAVLERRVWTETDVEPLCPNLYTVLAGAPASGKTIMTSTARRHLVTLTGPGRLFIGPDNPTKASFLDAVAATNKISINGMSHASYSAMTVLSSELGNFMSKYDSDFAADLTTFYDNPPAFAAPRRASVSVTIEAPCINILAAATPAALNDIIPANAWDQGFTSRVIFVYGSAPKLHRNIFSKRKEISLDHLNKELKRYFEELHGEFVWEPDAQAAMSRWFNLEDMFPKPTYGKLINYSGRRDVHVMKLAMISAVAGNRGLTVTLADFLRAKTWLLDVEKTMPDVFRAMLAKSDVQLLDDAHHHFYTKYNAVARDKRNPINERQMWEFFSNKVPHERIPGLIQALERTGRVKRLLSPGQWTPADLDAIDKEDTIGPQDIKPEERIVK